MVPYAIGLDVGIKSVGWAVLALNGQENPCGILDMGSRIFDAAEQPKTGASLAAPRREARSARRRLRRHQHRNERIRWLLVSSKLITEEDLGRLFDGVLEDVYALRARALDECIGNAEFCRVLLHIAQRRGFRSNRKGAATKEDGLLLKAVSTNQQRMAERGYRTVGEMFLRDPLFTQHKRNKGGEYIATVSRAMVEDEVHQIFASQRLLGNPVATEKLESSYLEILLSQRSFDEGPGGESPYAGNQILNKVGLCTFEPDERRAAKASYSFEYFTLLERINHLRIVEGGESVPLTAEQRATVVELAHKSDNLTYDTLRKKLGLSDTQRFNAVRYEKDATVESCEKKTKLKALQAYHQIRRAMDKLSKGCINDLPREQLNEIGFVLTVYKTSAKIREHLERAGLAPEIIDAVEDAGNFSGFGHISVKACDKIIPHLEVGMNYSDACTAAGYSFKSHDSDDRSMLLHMTEDDVADITSPVVRRAVSQTVKVLNAIIRRQGNSPTYINIELAREMSKDFSERNKLDRAMQENHARNERLMERIRNEFGKDNPTGQDLVKLKLFEEQAGVCAYSIKQMSLEKLFDPDYAEIDHIIPYSLSFDDSYKNKVLVLSAENRNKGNRLPLEYLSGKRRDDFIVWVNASVRDERKRRSLLKERLTDDDFNRFKERNLQDTKYISRFLYNYINDHLEFAPSTTHRKKRVTAVNGSVTSYMRKRWGIQKIRGDGDLHHAVDAVVIACTTDGMIQQVSRYAAFRECEYTQDVDGSFAVDPTTGEVLRKFPYPWEQFRTDLAHRLADDLRAVTADVFRVLDSETSHEPYVHPLFVSRMPHRKVKGAAHKDTIRSKAALEQGYSVVKRPLSTLKLDKDGEIEGYFDRDSDRLLYNALKARLAAYGGKGEKAFTEPFYKPKSDGTPGPLVNKVKICEKTTLQVDVHDETAIADHDTMVRIDVFYVENDGYYLIPIYVADTLKSDLPNRACVANKSYAEWKEMKDEDFVFSLYPNDLIKVTHKKALTMKKAQKESTLPDTRMRKSELLYYRGADISVGAINCINHDSSYMVRGIGIKTLERIEKYAVDVLGEVHPVKREKRQVFNIRRK